MCQQTREATIHEGLRFQTLTDDLVREGAPPVTPNPSNGIFANSTFSGNKCPAVRGNLTEKRLYEDSRV